MTPLLVTPYDLSRLTGDPHTSISVTNLQTTLSLTDAWGRRNIPQPVLISTHISLTHPFTTASSTDTVSGSTIHYGTLSKAILEACERFKWMGKEREKTGLEPLDLRSLVDFIRYHLTGWMDGDDQGQYEGADGADSPGASAFKFLLKGVEMRLFELEVTLPKASLMGSGVSLKGGFTSYVAGKEGPSAYSIVLKLNGLKVPTLVGVNPNERLAKQMVLVDVELSRWNSVDEIYCRLEEVIVKSTEESSFQTLEALALYLIERIMRYITIPLAMCEMPASPRASPDTLLGSSCPKPIYTHPVVKVSLSKPTAVTFADAPTVSMVVDTDAEKSEVSKRVWEEVRSEGYSKVPFPLQGRLDEWIEKDRQGE